MIPKILQITQITLPILLKVVLTEVQRETAKLKMLLNGEGEEEADKENAAVGHRAVFVSRSVSGNASDVL